MQLKYRRFYITKPSFLYNKFLLHLMIRPLKIENVNYVLYGISLSDETYPVSGLVILPQAAWASIRSFAKVSRMKSSSIARMKDNFSFVSQFNT